MSILLDETQKPPAPKVPTRRSPIKSAFGIGAIAAVVASIVVAPSVEGVLGGCLALIMAAIAIIDARHLIIPNELTAASFILGLVYVAFRGPESAMYELVDATLRATVLASALLALRAFYEWLRDREGIGLGDVKLAGVAGVWLHWNMMPASIDLAALAALIVCGWRYVVGRRPLYATSRVPFGQFFAPAIWLCWAIDTALPRF